MEKKTVIHSESMAVDWEEKINLKNSLKNKGKEIKMSIHYKSADKK